MKWIQRLHRSLELGLFAHQDEYENVKTLLLTSWRGLPTPQNNGQFAMNIDEYISRSSIIGALDDVEPKPSVLSGINPSSPGTIIVARGRLRLQFIHELGETLDLDPSLLLEHLGFPCSFRITPLPSKVRNCASAVTVRFINLGAFLGDSHSPQEADKFDPELRDSLYSNNLDRDEKFSFSDGNAGVTRCRALYVHNGRNFSFEQQSTFFTYCTAKDSWSGVLLNDCSNTIGYPPWVSPHSSGANAFFYPLSRYGHRRASLFSPNMYHSNSYDVSNMTDFETLIHPDPFKLRACGDVAMPPSRRMHCSRSPLIFLSDILDTSALSWLQLLSFIRESHRHHRLGADSSQTTLLADKLCEDKRLLDHAIQYFSSIITFLRNQPQDWPTTDQTALVTAELIADFSALREEAELLSKQCNEFVAIAMSKISIMEAKESLTQTRRVKLLTYLAAVFIPLSFVASCFGMNIRELESPGDGLSPVSFQHYVVFAVPFAMLVLALPLWTEIGGMKNVKRFAMAIWKWCEHILIMIYYSIVLTFCPRFLRD